jgi:hypothetical protein
VAVKVAAGDPVKLEKVAQAFASRSSAATRSLRCFEMVKYGTAAGQPAAVKRLNGA